MAAESPDGTCQLCRDENIGDDSSYPIPAIDAWNGAVAAFHTYLHSGKFSDYEPAAEVWETAAYRETGEVFTGPYSAAYGE